MDYCPAGMERRSELVRDDPREIVETLYVRPDDSDEILIPFLRKEEEFIRIQLEKSSHLLDGETRQKKEEVLRYEFQRLSQQVVTAPLIHDATMRMLDEVARDHDAWKHDTDPMQGYLQAFTTLTDRGCQSVFDEKRQGYRSCLWEYADLATLTMGDTIRQSIEPAYSVTNAEEFIRATFTSNLHLNTSLAIMDVVGFTAHNLDATPRQMTAALWAGADRIAPLATTKRRTFGDFMYGKEADMDYLTSLPKDDPDNLLKLWGEALQEIIETDDPELVIRCINSFDSLALREPGKVHRSIEKGGWLGRTAGRCPGRFILPTDKLRGAEALEAGEVLQTSTVFYGMVCHGLEQTILNDDRYIAAIRTAAEISRARYGIEVR